MHFSDNSGPGIFNAAFMASATVTILNSALTRNSGGIHTSGFEGGTKVTVNNSTISHNSADLGGGIYSYWSPVFIASSTLSGNSAGTSGGAIFNNTSGYVRIDNSTLSGNSAASGGGIYTVSGIDVSNTILNAGVSGGNIFNNGGTVTSYGYNLSSDDGGGFLTGPGDQVNTDPLLSPLQHNGGPTLTHLPSRGSPAIDAGDPNFMPPPFSDQRGPCFRRMFGPRIDVGSVETQPRRRCATPAPRLTP
jgi:predicted outer membrane repeat protein